MKYLYQARTSEGKLETGTVEASSKEAAALLLQKYNIYVTSLKEEAPRILKMRIGFLSKVSKKKLAVFSRQLAVLLQSRVPVTQSLKSLAVQIKDEAFKEKVMKIAQLVEEGNSLSDAFGAFPGVFNVFYVSLIKTGEASGKISETLYYLSEHLEREDDIASQIKSAMVYPIFVICVLFVVVVVVVVVVMPKLIDLMKEATTAPPLTTMLMINFYGFLMQYGWALLAGFAGTVAFLAYYFTTKAGHRTYDKYSLKIPFLKSLLTKIFLIRFAENISTLIGSGLSINNAIKITKDTIENSVYKEILTETEKRVSEGEKISSVLERYPDYAPPFVVQMIQVGEDTGKLDRNLMEIVTFYQKEVKRAIDTFTALLEPMLIIFLGIIVALLAVTVLSPLYSALGTI